MNKANRVLHLIEKFEPPKVKTVGIDFDGTLTVPMKIGDIADNTLQPGAKEGMEELKKRGYTIIIDTCRSQVDDIKKFLDSQGVPYDYINENPNQPKDTSSTKIYADVKLDDKVVTHTNWEDAVDKIETKYKEIEARRNET